MSDSIKPVSYLLPKTNPIAPPPHVHKVTDSAQHAVQTQATPRTPSAEHIASRMNKNKASENISLVVTPISTPHSISTPQLLDVIVKYRGIRYRATYRLKEGETTPDDFEDYLLAILEASHKNVETEANIEEQQAKKELLKKPFMVQDAGENAYTLSTLATSISTSIQIEIPPRYLSHREKMDSFTLPEYHNHTERSLNGLFPHLPKPTTAEKKPPSIPLPIPQRDPPAPSPLSSPKEKAPLPIPKKEEPPPPPAPASFSKTGLEEVEEFRKAYLEKAAGDPVKIKRVNLAFDEMIRAENIGKEPVSLNWIREMIQKYAKITQEFGFPFRRFFRKRKPRALPTQSS